MRTVGLIVNPIAGMGGSVGLKGTDGVMHARALALGAEPVSPRRTREFLDHLRHCEEIRFMAAPGPMGADYLAAAGLQYAAVGDPDAVPSPDETRTIARQMCDSGVEIIVFAGGDGTARDITDAVGVDVPVVAIPAGVKVYSSVFAFSPRAAADLLDAFIQGATTSEEEVLDIDEDAYRAGRVESRHHGFLLVPEAAELVQAGKESSGMSGSTAEEKHEIASYIAETMEPGVLYLLGCGTTVREIAVALGIDKTLLGVDAVVDGQLIAVDANEQQILALLDEHKDRRVVVTPLGGNGFIFGRGNKQFSPRVLRRIGRKNVIVVSNRSKLAKLEALHVDTGDAELDATLSGYIDVVVGRGYRKLMRVR